MRVMDVIEWLKSTTGLISAVGALLASIGALWPQISRIRHPADLPIDGESQQGSVKHRVGIRGWFGSAGILLLSYSVVVFAARYLSERNLSPNAALTARAWEAFGKADYESAIRYADKCIEGFGPSADREQAKLETGPASLPPTGKVSDEERQAILARGVLNDVATCLYIRGRAAEALGQRQQARAAYQKAARYTYARTWDPKGWFWSPAEAASDRLQELK